MPNILIVHDAEQSIEEIKMALSPGRHQILIAKNVASAMTLLRATSSFDLVICSVHLTDGTVFDLLKFVKSNPVQRVAPFVCLGGSPTELGRSVDELAQLIAKLLGADKYVAQAEFNAEQFRADIELILFEPRWSNCRTRNRPQTSNRDSW